MLTWVDFCYGVLLEPCDGFSDSLPALLEIICYPLGFAFKFLAFAFSYLVGWIFLVYVWGFKKDSFTLVVVSQSLLGRWVGHLKFLFIFENGGVLPR